MHSKIALITGGSRGLGKDMAMALASKGVDVLLTYHTKKEEAHDIAADIRKMGRKAAVLHYDSSLVSDTEVFLQHVQGVLQSEWNTASFDYLILNAGIGATVPIEQVTEELFDRMLNIHFKSVYFLTQKALPMMNDNGSCIFISSGSTRFLVPGYSVYSSMKNAVEMFSRFVAKEYGSRGIRSNVVAPGPTETDFNNAFIRSNPHAKTHLSSLSPLGRVGAADDIGSVVAFLCSDEAKWINAQRIEVSGGINT